MPYIFRKAQPEDATSIWEILQAAIQRRKEDGSNQWQDGYPNPEAIASDIREGYGYVLVEEEAILGYAAILYSDEPEYDNLEGEWLSTGDFLVYHRVAIAQGHVGKGLATVLLNSIEGLAKEQGMPSIKADTNHDNGPMLHLFDKLGYTYCGQVYFRGSPRRAYEKVV